MTEKTTAFVQYLDDYDLDDYDSVVEQTTDYLATVIDVVCETGSAVGAWDSVEQYIVGLLEDYNFPVELTGRVMRQACEIYEEQNL